MYSHIINKNRKVEQIDKDITVIPFFDWLNSYIDRGGRAFYPSLLYFNYGQGTEFLFSDDGTGSDRRVGDLFLEVVITDTDECFLQHDLGLIKNLVKSGFRIKPWLELLLKLENCGARLERYFSLIQNEK